MTYLRVEMPTMTVRDDAGDRQPVVGDRLIARGPHRPSGEPDVEGTIEEVPPDGRIVRVKEGKYDTLTTVNLHGGWASVVIIAAVTGIIALAS